MKTLYQDSWRLYKAQSESFTDDYLYYYNFCKGHKTLDIFAGYGRLSNFLIAQGVDLEIVELEQAFAKFINLDTSKKHIQDILTFSSNYQFSRVIAGWNSFCLFTQDNDIKKFFSQLDSLLSPEGYASLSYFDTKWWKVSQSAELMIDNMKFLYHPKFDLSANEQGIAVWADEYTLISSMETQRFEYPVKVYKSAEDLIRYYSHTSLELIDIVENFGLEKENISEPGWIDYVFKKKKNYL